MSAAHNEACGICHTAICSHTLERMAEMTRRAMGHAYTASMAEAGEEAARVAAAAEREAAGKAHAWTAGELTAALRILAEAREVIADYLDGDTDRVVLGKAALATLDHIDELVAAAKRGAR